MPPFLLAALPSVKDIYNDLKMWHKYKKPPARLFEQVLAGAPPSVRNVILVSEAALQQARTQANARLSAYEPWQLLLAGFVAAFVLARLITALRRSRRSWVDKGWKQCVSGFLFDLPGVRGAIARQQREAITKLRASLQKSSKGEVADGILTLPAHGISAAQIKQRLARKTSSDVTFDEGDSHISGAVYMSGTSHQVLLNEIYKKFSITNPIHADVWPSVRKMEAEVVAMTASLLGGGPAGDPGVCGAMTSGGTESILTAVKASRDYAAAVHGITEPEMVVADSAHPAFIKAAEYFKIRLVKVRVGKDYRLSGSAVGRAIGRNTVLVVASSPGFPHGVMDHIEDIAKVKKQKNA